jgi:hypothetical protein
VLDSEATPDEFEIAARIWQAHGGIIAESYTIAEILDLDPVLVERMQIAARGDDAIPAMREHVADLVAAVNEELAARSS